MRKHPDMVEAAFFGNKRRGASTMLSASHPRAALPSARASDLTGSITSAIHGMCLAVYPRYGGQTHGDQGGLIAAVARCRRLSSQRWILPGDNTIRNRGKCLAVTGGTYETGAVLAACDGSARQFWEADGVVMNPAIELLNPWSGRCLDDPHGSRAEGTQVQIHACNRSPEQIWYLPR